MRHEITPEDFGPLGQAMAGAIEDCVHCGFCLPACPTYQVLGQEMDSPRGRIVLMKEVLEGSLELEVASGHLDACLGCLACVSACPSGVEYGELITSFRMTAGSEQRRSPAAGLARRVLLNTIPEPGRFRLAAKAGKVGKLFAPLLPAEFQAMLGLVPERLPPAQTLKEYYPAIGEQRGHVALLAGCAQQVLEPGINLATIHVLNHNGVAVSVPSEQKCCGALAAHTGELARARKSARHALRTFPSDVDAILTNAAGCGSGLKEYRLWLLGEPEEAAAAAFGDRSMDVSAYLARLGILPPAMPPGEQQLRVAYHDACHLVHGQGVSAEPRQIIRSVSGVELVELTDNISCCGSAGTYNIEQPRLAAELGRRKAQTVRTSGADLIVTGNIGCLSQLKAHVDAGTPVMHLMQFLAAGYGPEGSAWQ